MAIIKKQSLSDQLYNEIRSKIINLAYPMGSKVNVNELQETYGVSSTPIREAINRLQVEGLVTYENNVGAKVVSLKENDIKEIQNLALVLHSAAIGFAMKSGNVEAMKIDMEKHLVEYHNARSDEEIVNSIFHFMGVFYKNCGNERLYNNMKVIQGEQLMLRYLYLTKAESDKSSNNYLEKMYKAVVDGNIEKIIEALSQEYNKAIPVLVEAVEAFN